jgi:MFS family permease
MKRLRLTPEFTRRTLLVIGVGVFVVGLLMVLWAPPECPPVAATAGANTCHPSWPVGVGAGLMVVAAMWILALVFPVISRTEPPVDR